jgi:transketolase N-terminal domain/subunit
MKQRLDLLAKVRFCFFDRSFSDKERMKSKSNNKCLFVLFVHHSGLSIGVGEALSAQRSKLPYRTYVVMGDGEVAEGSVRKTLNKQKAS